MQSAILSVSKAVSLTSSGKTTNEAIIGVGSITVVQMSEEQLEQPYFNKVNCRFNWEFLK